MATDLPKYLVSGGTYMATQIVNHAQKLATRQTRPFAIFLLALADALEHEALTTTYPTGAVLFAEGQSPRGVFIVRRGRVKLSICGSDGRTLILRIVDPGCPLGVAAVVSGRQYEATAETPGTQRDQLPAPQRFAAPHASSRRSRPLGYPAHQRRITPPPAAKSAT